MEKHKYWRFDVLKQEMEAILLREPEFLELSVQTCESACHDKLLVQYTAMFRRKSDGAVMGQQFSQQYPIPLTEPDDAWWTINKIVKDAHNAAYQFLEAHEQGLGGFHVLQFGKATR